MRKVARIIDIGNCHGTPASNATIPWNRDVFISGAPAARYLDKCSCGGYIITANPNVLISGIPAVGIQDTTSHGGVITGGDSTVVMGNAVFKNNQINEIIERLEDARNNAREKRKKADQQKEYFERLKEEAQKELAKPPTQGSMGLPQDPRDQYGPRLSWLPMQMIEGERAREYEKEAKTAENEVTEIEQELSSFVENSIK